MVALSDGGRSPLEDALRVPSPSWGGQAIRCLAKLVSLQAILSASIPMVAREGREHLQMKEYFHREVLLAHLLHHSRLAEQTVQRN